MEMQLVLVRLVHVKDFHVAALHAHGQPLPSGAVSKGEYLQDAEQPHWRFLPNKLRKGKGDQQVGGGKC